MPRDDLTIDFVKMPNESLDPGTILEEFIDRTRNLPEELRFIMDEVAEKDRQHDTCIKLIEDRENRIQKWIKANGSHTPNPKEAVYRQTIREYYDKVQKLSDEKLDLLRKCHLNYDKHLRALDGHIKNLHDRNEPGFQDPDELPSLIRPSAANHSAPSERSVNPAATHIAPSTKPIPNSATPSSSRAANPQIRINTNQPAHAASAPATPAASMIMNRQARESSAGPASGASKRGPRANSGLGTQPANSSNLARHSSVGPGTPKAAAVSGPQRAGSAGPRATVKGTSTGPGRKAGTPGAVGRKKAPGGTSKSNLARMKRPSKNSPSSTAESELSDADSASESAASSRRGTPARGTGASQGAEKESQAQTHPKTKRATATAGDDDEDAMDVDDDEAGDDKKYCLCQNVSFGDMVACDNDDCPYEWFHWSCVGLKSEPNGTWYCPVCSAKLEKTDGKAGATKKGK